MMLMKTRVAQDLISAYEYFFLACTSVSQKGAISNKAFTGMAREAHSALFGRISSLSLEPEALSRVFIVANIDQGIPTGHILEK